ncbi:aldose epimerase family protein [Dysgonomonas sp. GY617]|uniref:aldose epimerase family protein n=1 Tax=Dysgonomonas sp. GY617 TaxID=2780420 RepID=UPI0018832846|nr:aldose epimerase family protein [Dysgonomonas sp. GY617]MBF0574346.1 galactose mutarotase [Dysgonomonas sp. GY617]
MKTFIYLSLLICLFSCNKHPNKELPLLNESAFKTEVDGKAVDLYTLKSASGLTMQVTNLGARVVALWVPDKNGKYEDIVLGYDSIDRYINNKGERFLGPIVGRYANRIAKGQFELDGTTYQLPINNNGQTLHGGLKGLDMVVWNVDKVTDNEIHLSYVSPDGEEGFPGTMKIDLTYALTPENEFKITYAATTDKATVINLSHHGLFNLKGEGNGTITDHILTINASNTTPVDSVLIPSGEIASVEGTPFDFRKPTSIGERIDVENEQLKNGAGYDHNWVIDRKTDKDVELVASIYEPASGRKMEVWTDQPGLQFYSGNFFDGKVTGKTDKPLKYREAFALETQHFPDSPNHANFPTTRLNPGETYTQTCIYKFSVQK